MEAPGLDAQGLHRTGTYIWELPPTGGMRVPGRIYADAALVDALGGDESLDQVANVAYLPGIVRLLPGHARHPLRLRLPHRRRGRVRRRRTASSRPGGVGYDINCGVRLLATDLTPTDVGRTA